MCVCEKEKRTEERGVARHLGQRFWSSALALTRGSLDLHGVQTTGE